MTVSPEKIAEFARRLDSAAHERQETVMFAEEAGVDLDTPYAIQDLNVAQRYSRGDRRIGWKMGLTSKAKMEQMGVDSPICGILTETMKIEDGGTLELAGFIHPKVEPEIAFHIQKDIPHDVKEKDLLGYVSGVCCGMEIIDSRFKDFKFTLKDVIADNCSSSAFVLSKTVLPPYAVDTENLGMVLSVNGRTVSAGSSAAIFDHPVHSLMACVRMLIRRGQRISKGEIVLAGASTAAVPFEPGDKLRTVVQNLGEVSFLVS